MQVALVELVLLDSFLRQFKLVLASIQVDVAVVLYLLMLLQNSELLVWKETPDKPDLTWVPQAGPALGETAELSLMAEVSLIAELSLWAAPVQVSAAVGWFGVCGFVFFPLVMQGRALSGHRQLLQSWEGVME